MMSGLIRGKRLLIEEPAPSVRANIDEGHDGVVTASRFPNRQEPI